jgi:hypothetical protein
LSQFQRLALIGAALVILVVAVVVTTGGDNNEDSSSAPTAQTAAEMPPATDAPEAQNETTTSGESAAPPEPVLTKAKVTRLKASKGEEIRFSVRSSAADEVHVHGYDILRDVAPGKTVKLRFKAEIEGIFEIELEKSGVQIGKLEVRP